MTELADPHFGYWTGRYGTVFMLGSLGMVITMFYLWKWHGIPLVLALTVFVGTTFFRWPLSAWIGEGRCNTLFLLSLGLTVLGISIACLRKVPDPLGVQGDRPSATHIEHRTFAMLAWFLLWVALSRGGKRYDFFIGIPLAYGTAWLLWQLPTVVLQNLSHPIKYRWVVACFTIAILIPILCWNPTGGHATRAVAAAAKWRKPTPGKGSLTQTLNWMKTTLPESAIVVANWSYGSQLNVLGGVKTVTDQDTFIPYWIHLYYRHVYCEQSVREALTFLKTHGATHLMLTEWGLTSKARRYSYIGSNENSDRRFEFARLISLSDKRLSGIGQTSFRYIEAPDIKSPPDFLTAHLIGGNTAGIPYVAFKGGERYLHKTSNNNHSHGSVILYYDDNMHLSNAYYTPSIGWQSLSVRLYFLEDLPDIFAPIYSANGDDIASVKVWEIHYPPDIETDEKHLTMQPEPTER